MILLQGRLLALIYLTLFGAWLFGELVLTVKRRAKTGLAARDRGFAGQALLVVLLTNVAAIVCVRVFRGATFATAITCYIGLVLMSAGLLLRYSLLDEPYRLFDSLVSVLQARCRSASTAWPEYQAVRTKSTRGRWVSCFGQAVLRNTLYERPLAPLQ